MGKSTGRHYPSCDFQIMFTCTTSWTTPKKSRFSNLPSVYQTVNVQSPDGVARAPINS